LSGNTAIPAAGLPRAHAASASAGYPSRSGEAPPAWVVSWDGGQPYEPMWDLQRRLWALRHGGRIPDCLLLLEHEPVVTLGRNARKENLLLPAGVFRERGVTVVEVDRGGDVTYHGPGQLVGYWIFDLRELWQDAHRYLRSIEEVLIVTLGAFGLESGRDPKATGVWIGGEKVAALGLHLSHWVSTHGFALNINTDLSPFGWIVPCGLAGRGVTSMARLLGREVPRKDVEGALVPAMEGVFGRRAASLTPAELCDVVMALESKSAQESAEPGRLACPA